MTSLETLCLCLLAAIVFAGVARGILDRSWPPFLVALAAFAPLLVTCLHLKGLLDISSAHHPARIGSSTVALSAGMLGAYIEAPRARSAWGRRRDRATVHFRRMKDSGNYTGNALQMWEAAYAIVDAEPRPFPRALIACIITTAMACTSVPALFTWAIPGEFLLVPIQVLACFAVLVVLLTPERWLPWKS